MTDPVVIDKNAREELHVTRTEFNGQKLIDCRVFIKPITRKDVPTPTKKGLSLRDASWRQVLPHIQALLTPAEDDPPDGDTADEA